MKYLPDKHLIKQCEQNQAKANDAYRHAQHPLQAKADFSIASLQYMKKYNLLPSSGNFCNFINKIKIPRN